MAQMIFYLLISTRKAKVVVLLLGGSARRESSQPKPSPVAPLQARGAAGVFCALGCASVAAKEAAEWGGGKCRNCRAALAPCGSPRRGV